MHAIECKWRSENSTYLLIMGPRNQTHVIKVGGQYLYWMSHLTNRVIYIPFFKKSFVVVETRSHFIVQADLELAV